MCGYTHGSSSSEESHPHASSNAFTAGFLDRLGERDEPLTAGEAAVAGPWRIEPVPGRGFGLFRAGQSLVRGGRPAALCPSRWMALVTAAVLPGTGRDPLFRLGKEPDAEGFYPVTLDTGDVVMRLEVFDDTLIEHVNVLIHLLQSPQSLADALEAGGAEALGACGALLDERISPAVAVPSL